MPSTQVQRGPPRHVPREDPKHCENLSGKVWEAGVEGQSWDIKDAVLTERGTEVIRDAGMHLPNPGTILEDWKE